MRFMTLHSNMLLLKWSCRCRCYADVFPLHSNMLLLKSMLAMIVPSRIPSLHSNMLLLKSVSLFALYSIYSYSANCLPPFLCSQLPIFISFHPSNHKHPLQFQLLSISPVFSLSQVDNHKKLLVLSFSTPQNSLGIHFSFLHLKTIRESLSSLITWFNSILSFKSCDSDISPSKTEFCICVKYFLQILKVLDSTFEPL